MVSVRIKNKILTVAQIYCTWSFPPDSSCPPSGLKARQVTPPVWPLRTAWGSIQGSSARTLSSHRKMVQSSNSMRYTENNTVISRKCLFLKSTLYLRNISCCSKNHDNMYFSDVQGHFSNTYLKLRPGMWSFALMPGRRLIGHQIIPAPPGLPASPPLLLFSSTPSHACHFLQSAAAQVPSSPRPERPTACTERTRQDIWGPKSSQLRLEKIYSQYLDVFHQFNLSALVLSIYTQHSLIQILYIIVLLVLYYHVSA